MVDISYVVQVPTGAVDGEYAYVERETTLTGTRVRISVRCTRGSCVSYVSRWGTLDGDDFTDPKNGHCLNSTDTDKTIFVLD